MIRTGLKRRVFSVEVESTAEIYKRDERRGDLVSTRYGDHVLVRALLELRLSTLALFEVPPITHFEARSGSRARTL
jgi:hypothetical protein